MEQERIKLAAAVTPGLAGDTYTLRAEQTATIPNCKIEPAVRTFAVGADPLRLSAEQVYSVYPPKDIYGKFSLALPHIVFKDKTLLWERRIGTVKGLVPWLALLLFDEREGAVLRSMASVDAFKPAEGIFCPVGYKEGMAENCMVLDVPAKLFAEVCPGVEDLKFTAHARCVSRENKVTEKNMPGEWLSVLLSSRYPADEVGATGIKNSCYVISLEHFGDFLSDDSQRNKMKQGESYHTVRVPVLYTWSFYCAADTFDFKTVFQGLDAGVLKLPEEDASRMPQEAAELTARGYAPVDHHLREGSSTVSWYHGPFLPKAVKTELEKPHMGSDEWLRYDPDMGMFDISYSAAFCLGRQLALQRTSYSQTLCAFRNNNKAEANVCRQYFEMTERLGLDSDGNYVGADRGREEIKQQMRMRLRQTMEQLKKGGECDAEEDI